MTRPQLPSRFNVQGLLGEGGSGRVFHVHDSLRDRDLALKLVTSAESAFLRREFDTLRQIRHENLIQVFDWGGLLSGEAYYTMELIEGEDWGRGLGVPQTADEVRRILTGVLRGLAHLHCHGEIHGDLKPGNILLGKGGVVKVADVGMGGISGASDGQSGTPGYAAPEIWEKAKPDTRSDLYSVGVMAYEALTGRHPFGGRTIREVVAGQMEGWVPSPGAHGARIPGNLERTVLRALERDPRLRHGTCDEFMEGYGVEDRVGVILGGKFVGRAQEVKILEGILFAASSGQPTHVRIVGPQGSGKTALIEEISHLFLMRGARVLNQHEFQARYLAVASSATPSSAKPDVEARFNRAVSASVETLLQESERQPLLVVADERSDNTPAQSFDLEHFCQYVWAIAEEQGSAPRVAVVSENSLPVPDLEFEMSLTLKPLSSSQVREAILGLLGKSDLQDEFVDRVSDLSGGVPGPVVTVLTYLAREGHLKRDSGIWKFRESVPLRELNLPDLGGRWLPLWSDLGPELQEALTAVSLLTSGPVSLKLDELDHVGMNSEHLAALEAKGWLRVQGGRQVIVSEAAREVVLEEAPVATLRGIARRLLVDADTNLSPLERMDIVMRGRIMEENRSLALEAARIALAHGGGRRVVTWLHSARASAIAEGELSDRREAELLLAEALHREGNLSEAADLLEGPEEGSATGTNARWLPRRALLLGRIKRDSGKIQEARAAFEEAVACAGSQGRLLEFLQAHAELAGISWEHGSEADRMLAIERIREAAKQADGATGLADVRAELLYGLGAALIHSGKSDDARTTLEQGFTPDLSTYWDMRLSNALATALHYAGDQVEAIRWSKRAWSCAEHAGIDAFKPRLLSNQGALLNWAGSLREALDQNMLSAKWSNRLGKRYEYAVAQAGCAFCQIQLGRYEDALRSTQGTLQVAERIGDTHFRAKGLELKAMCLFWIGRYADAEEVVESGLRLLETHGYVEVGPRLLWLLARIRVAVGDTASAERILSDAKAKLLATRDREDLWGVQVELEAVRAGARDERGWAESIPDVIERARREGLAVVQIVGGSVLGEIVTSHPGPMALDYEGLLNRSLSLAESSGMREYIWRISYWLGVIADIRGDERGRQTMFNRAIRVLKEIADALSPDHRSSYLGSSGVREALAHLSSNA